MTKLEKMEKELEMIKFQKKKIEESCGKKNKNIFDAEAINYTRMNGGSFGASDGSELPIKNKSKFF